MTEKIKYKNLICLRCSYEWTPLTENPKVCPKCKSYHWKTQRRQKR